MQPVPHISVQPPAVAAPFIAPSITLTPQGEEIVPQASASSPAAPMSWQQRGEFYLQRKELNQAVEAFTKALQEAEQRGKPEVIADSLKDLGRAFLEKEQWTLAAKIFNGAYALMQKSPDEKSRQATLGFIAEVERRFLEKVWKMRKAIDPKGYLERRQRLQGVRQEAESKIQKKIPAQTILLEFTQGISLFLSDILKSGFALFGQPPCDYTLIGLGSLARKEMSPYSDLEFAILIKKSSEDILEYFRKVVPWLELQVIHLGETAIKILEQGCESPVVRGFSFDEGGNTPLGKQGYVELIKTPKELAEFQSEKFYAEDLILSNVLRGVDVIVGSESLYKKYREAVQDILKKKSAKGSLSICQERALDLLRGHLVEFEPRMDKKKEETPVYNIKAELYRLPSFLIAGFAEFFEIGDQNTWKRLDALVKKKVLSPEGAQHLKEAMAAIMTLRIRCHLYYGKECEDVYHPSMQLKDLGKKRVYELTDDEINQIMEIYKVIFPLHRLFKQACQTRNFAEIAKESFYDNSLLSQGEAYEKLLRYAQAKSYYEQAVAMNPDDPIALQKLTSLFWMLEEHAQAREYAEKALALGMRKNNEKCMAHALNFLGLTCLAKSEPKKALTYFEEALQMAKRVYGHGHPDVAAYLNNLGKAWEELGDAKQAILYYEEALHIAKQFYGERHPSVAINLNNIGHVWEILGDAKQAISYYEESLNIVKKHYGAEHPQMAIRLNNLGTAWVALGNFDRAIECFHEALRIDNKNYGSTHPRVAMSLNNLGIAWQALGKAKQAIANYEKALQIDKKVYGGEHPHVAIRLSNLGAAWKFFGDTHKALSHVEEALRIDKQAYGDEHPQVATDLNNLGNIWQASGDHNKAIKFYEESLEMTKKIFGKQHPRVAVGLNNLGSAWKALGNITKAIDLYDEAMKIYVNTYSKDHPEVAICLNNLGNAFQSSGNTIKSIQHCEEGLRITKKVYGDHHPKVAILDYNLGLAWKAQDPSKAIAYYEEGLRIDKKVYGAEHPQVAIRLGNLAAEYQSLGNSQKAIELFEEALRIDQKAYGLEHATVATNLTNLGNAWETCEDLNKAVGYFEKALQVSKKANGPDHPETATSLTNLGAAALALDEAAQSIAYYEEALTIYKKAFGENHPDVAQCLYNLGHARKASGDLKTAVTCYEEALKVFGEKHPDAGDVLSALSSTWMELGDIQKAIAYSKLAP